MLTPNALEIVRVADLWLDECVSDRYKSQPLAQDWARVTKVDEEHGEAIAELILMTGQNPRKGTDPSARSKLLAELADKAITAILGIQHFTKDTTETEGYIIAAFIKIMGRATENGYPPDYRQAVKSAG
jgi:hypothetical protein